MLTLNRVRDDATNRHHQIYAKACGKLLFVRPFVKFRMCRMPLSEQWFKFK